LIKKRWGHPPKQGADAHLIVDVDAGSATTDCIDTGQVGRGPHEGVVHASEVVSRILLKIRIPRDLLGENDVAVDQSGRLAIAATEIESDATTVEVPTHGGTRLASGGEVGERARGNLEALAKDLNAHKLVIESPSPGRMINRGEGGGDFVGASDEDSTAALHPKQKLQEAL